MPKSPFRQVDGECSFQMPIDCQDYDVGVNRAPGLVFSKMQVHPCGPRSAPGEVCQIGLRLFKVLAYL